MCCCAVVFVYLLLNVLLFCSSCLFLTGCIAISLFCCSYLFLTECIVIPLFRCSYLFLTKCVLVLLFLFISYFLKAKMCSLDLTCMAFWTNEFSPDFEEKPNIMSASLLSTCWNRKFELIVCPSG